jgi:hypothetical protein
MEAIVTIVTAFGAKETPDGSLICSFRAPKYLGILHVGYIDFPRVRFSDLYRGMVLLGKCFLFMFELSALACV